MAEGRHIEADPTLGADATDVIAGRYAILGILGVGGMGTVYKVHDLELDELVALKTLRRGWIDSPGALERFKREVKLARRVTHPNVARTFDIGEHRGPNGVEKFLTMELVDGTSLAHRLDARGALPIPDAIAIAIAIARALEAAHGAGVIHRDLKPDNVLLARDGRVLVTDFGIARTQLGDAAATGILGTPAYMAPEQVQAGPVDGRTDLYALGLVLYEMLVGARAFPGDQPFAVAAARLLGPPPDPAAARPDLPPMLVTLVRALVAREREARPASAASVRATLEAARSASAVAKTVALALVEAPRPSETARSIAVFRVRDDGSGEGSWLADGLTDDLVDALSMAKGLRVRSRVAPEPGEDAREFGRRLGVELVVEGTVRRTADDVRVTFRLSSVGDGYQVWAGRLTGRVGDLLTMVDRAAGEIASAIAGARVVAPDRAAADSAQVELYLRARRAVVSGMVEGERLVEIGREMLACAGDDPRLLALAASALARGGGAYRDEEAIAEARIASDRAIALAPTLGEPWIARVHLLRNDHDTPAAARALRRAYENAPSSPDANVLVGRILSETSRLEEGLRFSDRALWLDPSLMLGRVDLVRMLALVGQEERCLHELDALREASPPHYIAIGMRLSLWARRDVCERLPADAAAAGAGVRAASAAVWSLLDTGVVGEAELAGLRTWIASIGPRSPIARLARQLATEIYAVSGDRVRALAALEDAVVVGVEDEAWVERCPALSSLRGTPEMARAEATIRERSARVERAWLEG